MICLFQCQHVFPDEYRFSYHFYCETNYGIIYITLEKKNLKFFAYPAAINEILFSACRRALYYL